MLRKVALKGHPPLLKPSNRPPGAKRIPPSLTACAPGLRPRHRVSPNNPALKAKKRAAGPGNRFAGLFDGCSLGNTSKNEPNWACLRFYQRVQGVKCISPQNRPWRSSRRAELADQQREAADLATENERQVIGNESQAEAIELLRAEVSKHQGRAWSLIWWL